MKKSAVLVSCLFLLLIGFQTFAFAASTFNPDEISSDLFVISDDVMFIITFIAFIVVFFLLGMLIGMIFGPPGKKKKTEVTTADSTVTDKLQDNVSTDTSKQESQKQEAEPHPPKYSRNRYYKR
jgi:predicted membrane protein